MLFMDAETRRSESDRKEAARRDLELNYMRSMKGLEKYQVELRSALQAHNRGDYSGERRHYQHVMGMLRADNLDPIKGLTGIRRGPTHPADNQLADLLTILLANE